ncbi:MAG: Aspartyl-tRNA synthetase [Candidatus Wolfebacteria bacterium GW2011_GWC1_43_10]|nr:MAG: Aspartyl-tRNA synthetase [Candidatus Wolfebacteria bacterium GW2011_GWC1_43_10]KKT22705.1 MAG: Aspartyl-tRNA synthetase [Parcubacteria group bacterium GW2011_GWB1_43_8b]
MWIKDAVDKIGQEIDLYGWVDSRRDHGKLVFVDLRDRSAICQVVFSPASGEKIYQDAQKLRSEWVVKVSGLVKERPQGMINDKIPTGKIEIEAKGLEILNESKTPPFDLAGDGYEVSEDIRMQYRYLDLRRPRLKKNLVQRNRIIKFFRDFLEKKDFVEVETPIITKSTPEGARDYLVPSRVYPGNFYALPQSPQQYKQLLMVAGLEKYFQIARCFRDEDTRGDRQPEFTQLDLEMSFVGEEDILSLTEELYLAMVRTLYPQKQITLDENGKIPRITYQEVMEKYGSDKPDIRKDKNNPDELAFLFIVDFPMFEWSETEKRWDAVHHPFTAPKLSDGSTDKQKILEVLKKDPSGLLARQYDFVLNGCEIGGGSIRTHDPDILASVFEAMGNQPEEIKEKFGHMLEAFSYGVPPHGGIAPGIDRLVMVLEIEPNIREVIAFPKTGDGRDLMMHSPGPADEKQLKELGIQIIKKDK